MDIYERLFELMNEKQIKAVDLANHLNISKSVVSNWKTRGTNPPSNYLVGICELLNVSLSYLITGKEDITANTVKFTIEEQNLIKSYNLLTTKQKTVVLGKIYEYEEKNSIRYLQKDLITTPIQAKSIIETKENKGTKGSDFVILKVYEQRASAGIGKYMYEDVDFEEQKFPLDYRTQKADHSIIVDGNSMFPTIKNGQNIFIKEQQTIENNEVGIFVYQDRVYCKRLQIDRKNKRLTLVSDNKDYENIEVKNIDDLRTIGKVIL